MIWGYIVSTGVLQSEVSFTLSNSFVFFVKIQSGLMMSNLAIKESLERFSFSFSFKSWNLLRYHQTTEWNSSLLFLISGHAVHITCSSIIIFASIITTYLSLSDPSLFSTQTKITFMSTSLLPGSFQPLTVFFLWMFQLLSCCLLLYIQDRSMS